KSAKLTGRFAPVYIFIPDKMFQSGFGDCRSEGFQLLPVPFGDQLDSPVGEVADGAGYFIARRNGFHAITKPDALHVAGVKDAHSALFHRPHSRSLAAPNNPFLTPWVSLA